MKVPTIIQFNNWSDKDKAWWVEYETAGKCKQMKREDGYFPLILYYRENVGIVYQIDRDGNFSEVTAMTIVEALDRLERQRLPLEQYQHVTDRLKITQNSKTLKTNIMIQPGILQPGNYVTVENEKRGQIRKVEGIGYYDTVWLANDMKIYLGSQLAGIKITEQWLEYMGFYPSEGRQTDPSVSIYHLGSIAAKFNHKKQVVVIGRSEMEVSYVHELQNALRPAIVNYPR